MNKLAILGIGTTGVVAVGSGGLYMHYKNNETNSKEEENSTTVLTSARLTNEGFKPLTLIASDKDLKVVLEKYKVAKQNTFVGDASKATEETLIRECTKALSEDSKNDANYKLANQWCVKESTIDAIFSASGWKTLATEGDATADTGGHWAKKVEKHKASQDQNKIPKTLGDVDSNHIKEMKDGCKTLDIKKINTTDQDFNTKFEQVKAWCAIKE